MLADLGLAFAVGQNSNETREMGLRMQVIIENELPSPEMSPGPH